MPPIGTTATTMGDYHPHAGGGGSSSSSSNVFHSHSSISSLPAAYEAVRLVVFMMEMVSRHKEALLMLRSSGGLTTEEVAAMDYLEEEMRELRVRSEMASSSSQVDTDVLPLQVGSSSCSSSSSSSR